MALAPIVFHSSAGHTEPKLLTFGAILSRFYKSESTREIPYNQSYERTYRQSLTQMTVTPTESTQQRFRRLTDEWREETGGLSSPSQIAARSSYRQIIDMGESTLRYIFEDLRDHGGQWYLALRSITGASPVPPEA